MDLADKKERVSRLAFFERPPIISDRPYVWSPDGKWLAYVPVGENQFKNVHVVAVMVARTAGEFSRKRFQ